MYTHLIKSQMLHFRQFEIQINCTSSKNGNFCLDSTLGQKNVKQIMVTSKEKQQIKRNSSN